MANGKDHLVPLTHPQSMFDAIENSRMKRYLIIKGATHYYFGQRELMNSAVQDIKAFMREAGLLLEGGGAGRE